METLTITTAARRITRTCRVYGPAAKLYFDPATGDLLKAHEADLAFIELPSRLEGAVVFQGGRHVTQRYAQARLTAWERFPGKSPEAQDARDVFIWTQMAEVR